MVDVEVVLWTGSRYGWSVFTAGRLEFWVQLPRQSPRSWAEVHGSQPPGVIVCDTFANDVKVDGQRVVVAILLC